MKDFWKFVLAVIVGTIILNFIGMFMFFSCVGAIGSATSNEPVLPRKGVLEIDMQYISLAEQVTDDPAASLTSMFSTGHAVETIALRDAVVALQKAAEDPSVQYVLLRTDGMDAGFAQIEELRTALANLRKSGKAVVSYVENPGTGSYYLASVSDKVYMNSLDGVSPMMVGMGSQMIYYKDLLDKVGVNIQLIRHGKYKSAGEPFIRSTPSEDNIRQYKAMIDGTWGFVRGQICDSREIAPEDLDRMIEDLELVFPEDLLKNKLVDELFTPAQLEDKLAELAGEKKFSDVKFISFATYVSAKTKDTSKAKQKIAILYADGEIVDTDAGSGLGGSSNIVGKDLSEEIFKVANDESIKAVVFRVNSPGGSVLASARIKEAIDTLKAHKPVVASYGSYAASGGYWISNGCEKIYSDATTLTGSIGVFSIIPDVSKVVKEKAHLNTYTIGTSSHSDMLGLMRPLSPSELDFMQASVENIYDRFVTIVSEGRGLDKTYVDDIAQGRVWTGADAIGVKLVDEIGGLDEALKYTASIAGDPDLAHWKIESYPKVPTFLEQLMKKSGATQSIVAEFLPATTPSFIVRRLDAAVREFKTFTTKDSGKVFARMDCDIVIE